VNWMRRKRCPEAAKQHRLLANENANRLHLLESTSARYSQTAWRTSKGRFSMEIDANIVAFSMAIS